MRFRRSSTWTFHKHSINITMGVCCRTRSLSPFSGMEVGNTFFSWRETVIFRGNKGTVIFFYCNTAHIPSHHFRYVTRKNSHETKTDMTEDEADLPVI